MGTNSGFLLFLRRSNSSQSINRLLFNRWWCQTNVPLISRCSIRKFSFISVGSICQCTSLWHSEYNWSTKKVLNTKNKPVVPPKLMHTKVFHHYYHDHWNDKGHLFTNSTFNTAAQDCIVYIHGSSVYRLCTCFYHPRFTTKTGRNIWHCHFHPPPFIKNKKNSYWHTAFFLSNNNKTRTRLYKKNQKIYSRKPARPEIQFIS